ncbi:MAG: GatB/YqeY domain-containing protein [Gammaproteobacteria bacterium]|nr:GatB/YqeY domain-containing protein [Gammaproteobacteria bacterium]NIR98628.1 GatB/YqeY domain-containing protein [Gammaproteobacteria bacterium]NIT64351.1 GatB/YqeY domain-containing protein [Gammaproteobacteria bacterium]NIV21275.1 GatB/YqeY domain-containing protein [Gammaproteobacteria bacterium]NIX10979.1 GatB/YqeY domain-containing protein [Gammaproteobacteria bacterium]
MSLKQRITDDMKSAMRAGDKRRLAAIRLIQAAVKQREVDERIEALDDSQVIAVLDKMVKQRRESLEQYEKAGRSDLAEQESFELRVLQDYLPEALSEAELDELIEGAIREAGAGSIKDMGKVMGLLKTRAQGRADMGAVSAKVKARLGG